MFRCCLFALLLALAAPARDAKAPDLSGTWKVNIEKSKMDGPAADEITYVIADSESSLTMTIRENRNGTGRTTRLVYDKTGKESINVLGNLELRTVLEFKGADVLETTKFISSSGERVRKGVVSRAEDGKTLRYESYFIDSPNARSLVIFEKQ